MNVTKLNFNTHNSIRLICIITQKQFISSNGGTHDKYKNWLFIAY